MNLLTKFFFGSSSDRRSANLHLFIFWEKFIHKKVKVCLENSNFIFLANILKLLFQLYLQYLSASWSLKYVYVLSNQYICLFREVNKKLNKKKRDQSKLKAEDQQNYVDSSRSIAVSLDSKELSRALKHFSKDFV